MDKGKLQKLIHREVENLDVLDYSASLLFSLHLAKKVLRLSRIESFQDSSTKQRARSERASRRDSPNSDITLSQDSSVVPAKPQHSKCCDAPLVYYYVDEDGEEKEVEPSEIFLALNKLNKDKNHHG